MLKDLQFHAVNDAVLHIDLLEVTEDKPVVVEVPVHVEGHAVGVKAGGKLFLAMKKVKVKGIYTKLPEDVTVDVSELQIGQSIKVRDLSFDDFEMASPKELVITGVRATRASRDASATEEGEEAAAE